MKSFCAPEIIINRALEHEYEDYDQMLQGQAPVTNFPCLVCYDKNGVFQ